MLLRTFCWLTVMIAVSAPAAQRPRIVGIANIAVKVDNLDEARKFYSGVVGMAEAFQTRDAAVTGELACFKVNDRQYVEVSPTLKSETEDRLIRIGFETNDARELRNYLAGVPRRPRPEHRAHAGSGVRNESLRNDLHSSGRCRYGKNARRSGAHLHRTGRTAQ